jgi:hypothetical protein
MPGIVKVGNGHQAARTPSTAANTVLQINAGARLAGAIPNSALVITRGARINALGTTTNPIVFSSLDNDYNRMGEWGGLILSSWDDTIGCNTSLGEECTMEGISQGPFFYGGYIDATQTTDWDKISSGTVRYVVIAEGGHAINLDMDGDPDPNSNTGDEINGLTLYGVSSETSISNVHIHNSDDDGIQFFGGDVDVANVWVSCAGDDSVEWNFGFHGAMTNVNILQSDGADHAFELAAHGASVANVTLAFVDSTPYVDTPFKLEYGGGGTFSNVKIGYAYTGACFDSNAFGTPSIQFSSVDYACNDYLGLLPGPSVAGGFSNSTFWTGYPGTCN